MPQRKGGRPPNNAARAYQAPEKRDPDQVVDPAQREVARMLSRAAANVVEAQELQVRRRQERVEKILAAGEALRELGFDKKSTIAAFVAEFSGVGRQHADGILRTRRRPRP